MQGRRRKQISVPLNAEQCADVERTAAREDRSLAQVIRRLVARAARSGEISGQRIRGRPSHGVE